MKKLETTAPAKVLGFNGAIGKSVRKVENGKVTVRVRTATELLNDPLFVNACTTAAQKLDTGVANFTTKRQASKFFRGEGIVYKTVMEGDKTHAV